MICYVTFISQGKVTNELSQILEEEEKKWLDTLNVEEYQIPLARTVIQVRMTHRSRTSKVDSGFPARIFNNIITCPDIMPCTNITCCLNNFLDVDFVHNDPLFLSISNFCNCF